MVAIKKESSSGRKPTLQPTLATLKPAIMGALFQTYIWNDYITPNVELPPPEGYGWSLGDGSFKSDTAYLPPAPDAT